MNHSLLSADRLTHVKILAVALVAAVVMVAVGITGRIGDTSGASARNQTGYVVVKAGKPVVYTRSETSAIH